MAFDALTFSAFGVSLLVVVIVIGLLRSSERKTEMRIRRVARQTSLVAENHAVRDLCRAIRRQYPDACPGLDFELRPDNGGARVERWSMDAPPPSDTEIEEAVRESRGGS
ncbi:MAG: XkdW family protein [Chromatiales bacterium]